MIRFQMPKFIRRIVRRHTNQIPEVRALSMRRKLSYGYAFIAWNLFGLVAYMIYTGRIKKTDSDLSQAREFAKLLKKENVVLYRIEGVTPVGRFDLDEEFRKAEENKSLAEKHEDSEEFKSDEKQSDEFTFEEELHP